VTLDVLYEFEVPEPWSGSHGQRLLVRRNRLARGLSSLGLRNGDSIMVLCCENHQEDLEVALAAVRAIGASLVVPRHWNDPGAVRRLSKTTDTKTYLACEEGVEVWRTAGGRGRMIGDSPGVYWWKALEARHACFSDHIPS
jgi:hypothetical protein